MPHKSKIVKRCPGFPDSNAWLLFLVEIVLFFFQILDADKPRIVDKWDGNAVKNSLDDVVRKVCLTDWKICTF